MRTAVPTGTTVRARLARHSVLRREQRQLERELATYETPSARHELDAIISRHTADEAAHIRRVLSRRVLVHLHAGTP